MIFNLITQGDGDGFVENRLRSTILVYDTHKRYKMQNQKIARNAYILPDHARHPGWDADGCPLRITVTARTLLTSDGFACSATGGHCLPQKNPAACAKWVKEAAVIEAIWG